MNQPVNLDPSDVVEVPTPVIKLLHDTLNQVPAGLSRAALNELDNAVLAHSRKKGAAALLESAARGSSDETPLPPIQRTEVANAAAAAGQA